MGLAIFSSRIFTGDPARPWAEAIVTRNNKIAAVGSNREVKSLCPEDTAVLDLPGRLLTPGFVDAHTHFINLGLTLERVDLRNLPSLWACQKEIRHAVVSHHPGEWIIGRGWNPDQWEEKREPARRDLDDLSPRNPIMMIHGSGHTVWVNSLALARTGITRETPNPTGGRIERNIETGEPTGLIREARHLIEKHVPIPSLEELKGAALTAQREALRFGITGVHSCETLQQWEALASLEREGKLKLRVYHLLPPDDLEEAASREIRPDRGSERLWFGHMKLIEDGSFGSGTALLHEPYHDDPSHRGVARLTPEELREKIELAYQGGWDVAIHAIGDKALTHSLEAITGARKTLPGTRRDRIEHVQLFRPQDLALFRDLGLIASVQPVFVPSAWPVVEKRLGLTRCRRAYAWKSLLQAGIPLQFSSDAPVATINPLSGLHAAITRQTLQGDPPGGWFPEEKLSLEEGIRGYTLIPAWTSRRENSVGTLMEGKWADMTVFSQDLFHLSRDHWSSVEVEMTIVDGEIVYQREA